MIQFGKSYICIKDYTFGGVFVGDITTPTSAGYDVIWMDTKKYRCGIFESDFDKHFKLEVPKRGHPITSIFK
jgi:hypothetical protein